MNFKEVYRIERIRKGWILFGYQKTEPHEYWREYVTTPFLITYLGNESDVANITTVHSQAFNQERPVNSMPV